MEAAMIERPARFLCVLAVLAVAAAGCVTVPEQDAVLQDAHVSVAAARSNPQVMTYAPIELEQANAAMRDADELAARGGTIGEVHRLARLANQRATLAQDVARSRSAEAALAAQRAAQQAQVQADISRQQAASAQLQAAAAQRQADEAQRQAAATQLQAQVLQQSVDSGVVVAPSAVVVPGTVVAPGTVVVPGTVVAPNTVVVPELVDVPAVTTARGLVVTLDDAMFEPDGTRLRDSGVVTLRRLAAYLVAHPERVIAVEGFADTSTDNYRNGELSERRARTVQATLISLGVDPARTVVRAYGPAYPIASNATAAGRQMNRRVEIVVSDASGRVIPRG
jgi:outer membrane protein OmpA-like peptidoglycan-associated protein